MIQFVVGAAAGYVFGTKAGRRRYHQIKDGYEKIVNSPAAKSIVTGARKSIANRLDPEPRLKEVKDLSRDRHGYVSHHDSDRLYEPDED